MASRESFSLFWRVSGHSCQELTDEILFWKKVQFLFFYQWEKLKAYAEENNIKIIGDLPIYVSYDSADVWAHPEEFHLDENLCPIVVNKSMPGPGFQYPFLAVESPYGMA